MNQKIEKKLSVDYVLGLDIGSASVGWACIEYQKGRPVDVLATGVRLFESGMSGDFDKGAELSNAITRRDKRLARRQIHRKAVRKWSVFKLLRDNNLLPDFGIQSLRELSPHIHQFDKALSESYLINADHISSQLLVYRIRAKAAKEEIPLWHLGRALLHLSKRRGFNSNLRGTPKKDEDEGMIKSSIKSLGTELENKAMTLGEYFSNANPIDKRIRARWTGREMFLREFDTIWREQAKHHKELTEALYRKLRKAIFYQRPLRSAKGLVGKCSIFKKKRRLIAAHPLSQEVRMLQFLSNVLIVEPGKVSRQLSVEERYKAIEALSKCEKMTIKQFRENLDLPKKTKLNFDNDDDTHAQGMGTTAVIRDVLDTSWDLLDDQKKEQLIHELISFNKRDALIKHLSNKWGFTPQQAESLSEITLEPGYASHSRPALEAIRYQLLIQDTTTGRWPTYSEAKKKAFPESQSFEQCQQLPPIRDVLSGITNPSVIRSLTEVRKVVNELIQRYGIPSRIRIELTRDLKKSKKERKKIEEVIRDRAKSRSVALKAIRKEFGNYPEKSGYDRGIEMVMLAEECNWMCPYSGESITCIRDLLGDNSRFDIEHIYPRRYLDNSFANKTICLHSENRNVKKDRLPAIAYQADPGKYDEILNRVRRFKGPGASRKLERFLAVDVPTDFVNRQLEETRYMSRAAADYLGLLYGGRVDQHGKQRIFTVTGGLTALLRNHWRLNQILGFADEKNRTDHRHHAVDAVVIACTDVSAVQALQSAASDGWQRGGELASQKISTPFDGFEEKVRKSIRGICVSFRPNRRLNGPLHADTLYSVRRNSEDKFDVKIRKPITDLTESMMDRIVDAKVKQVVIEKYRELLAVNKPPKKAGELFSLENHPFLESSNGKRTPIHSVRIYDSQNQSELKLKTIGRGNDARYFNATGGSNYCTRVYRVVDEKGEEVAWHDRILSRLEAMHLYGKHRKTNNTNGDPSNPNPKNVPSASTSADPVDGFDESSYLFDLFINDYLIMSNKAGKQTLYRITSISKGDIEIRVHTDGRRQDILKKSADRMRIRQKDFSKRSFRKVMVSPGGQVVDYITGEIIDQDFL
jgi:CRISPR-associated endonuclease Csn1